MVDLERFARYLSLTDRTRSAAIPIIDRSEVVPLSPAWNSILDTSTKRAFDCAFRRSTDAKLAWVLAVRSADSFDLPDSITFLTIFSNNLLPLAGLLTGPVTLGIANLAFLSFNGATIGIITGWSLNNGLTPVEIGLLIVLHGIFEFPALWIASAAGLKLPLGYLQYFRGRQDTAIREDDVDLYFRLAILSVVLLAIGAMVEATVTKQLIKHVAS